MIHYHGTPIGGTLSDKSRFLAGRHALVPFPRQDDLGIVAETCQSFVFDNGAFTVWKQGGQLDVDGYLHWVDDWYRHPGFDWALIPDVIDGDEEANDRLLEQWPTHLPGVPVWHLHESLERLQRLAGAWRTVAIGSSGNWRTPGTASWWKRISAAMGAICDEHGRPRCRLHGLRMLDPKIFSRLPFASADSTNAAVNGGSIARFGMYVPPTAGQRAEVIASRIESHNSANLWVPDSQIELSL
ncbi:hypothetical protein AB7A53_005242 [Pseudomonas aeruginosa]|mgnify:FL=1|jgi:hypothetical protein|uniref:hypothetical protein n=1 Tax=Pseudomonas aeruginosa group TaxID=136841 RepID=UPI0003B9A9EB|nr:MULTISPECIES: hypothetical protein [Pseudomonas aeruginosa group]EKU7803417.1 hypothetical protein [Pseudomonas aeruginosa]EKV3151022.1 hypothetical protein [Pseudomonas aeruginosa]EKX4697010.1 hypothetical protein [Pseudomonas aeruginosa]EKX6151672.1 hypothetical protein [Pseudomonas aeruginosa]EKY4114989.1 hypothetical protein [Pseudomonas aeruginosa]